MRYNSAKEVLDAIAQAYYEDRDIEATLSCVTDDIEWIGTENNDSASGKNALRELLNVDMAHYPDAYGVEMQQPKVQLINKDVVLFTILGKQKDIPGISNGLVVRGTVCCIRTEQGWLVNNVHTSAPSADREKQKLEHELEQTLKRDKDRFKLVVDEVNAAIFEWDLQKYSFYHSEAYQQYAVSKVSAEDILNNRGTLDVVHPDDIGILQEYFAESKSGQDKAECTLRLKLVNGGYRWCRMLGLFHKDENGVPTHTIGIIIDINEEHERNILMNHLLNQVPGGIAIYQVDDNGIHQTFANQGFYRSFGINKELYEKYAGYNILKGADPEEWAQVKKQIERLKAGADECDFMYRCKFPGKESMWVRLKGAVSERQGETFTLYAAFMDVTQQIIAQTRQKELFDTIPSGILEFFFDGEYARVISANQTLMDMIGYSEEEFTAIEKWNLANVVHPEDYHLLVEARKSITLGKGKTYDFRLFNKNTGRYRWISCDFTIAEHTNTGMRVISAFLDVEDKRRAEDASAAKSRFLSRMSHEIRTPINAIMGIAELEKQDIESHMLSIESVEQYSKEILTASNYLLTIVNDILDTSRIENNQIEIQQHPIHVEQYLADVQTLVEPLAKNNNIHFICERKTGVHEVYIGDGVRIKQIIVNLLNNAFKFTPAGGTVRLTSEIIKETSEHATVQFTVSDNGIGMSKEFLEKLFTPFSQENSENTSPFAGTGLGLSIAKSLAIKMGGDITCTSEQGKGTTFIATIVVNTTKNENTKKNPEKDEETAVKDIQFEGVRILVCEDHPLNQKITRALLERKNCIVEIAEDGVIAVDMFEKSAIGYYSVILMDIRMPNMDGLQATKEIRHLERSDAKTVSIVAMSANAYDEDVQESIAAGMNDHLAKPVDATKLYQTIARYTKSIDSAYGIANDSKIK